MRNKKPDGATMGTNAPRLTLQEICELKNNEDRENLGFTGGFISFASKLLILPEIANPKEMNEESKEALKELLEDSFLSMGIFTKGIGAIGALIQGQEEGVSCFGEQNFRNLGTLIEDLSGLILVFTNITYEISLNLASACQKDGGAQ